MKRLFPLRGKVAAIVGGAGHLGSAIVRAMREAGLLATLNTDDPAMTDLDLGKEYRSVAEAQGLGFDDLAAVALDGIEAFWLDDVDRRVLRRDFSQALEDLRPQAPAGGS